MLSPAELWKRSKEKVAESSNDFVVNMKYEDKDGSFLQSKQLEYSLTCLRHRVSQEKIDKLGSLSIGEYDDECEQVVVKAVKGKVWSHFGYTHQGTMKLYPEEALFLMDVGTLRVSRHGIPLSMQEALLLFLRSDLAVSMEHYLVYNYMNRLGYIIRRQTSNNEECSLKMKKAIKKRKTSLEIIKSSKALKSSESENHSDGHNAVGSETSHLAQVPMDAGDQSRRGITPILNVPANRVDSDKKTEKYTKFDYSQIVFPSEGGMKPRSADETIVKLSEAVSVPATTVSSQGEPTSSSSKTDHSSGYFSFLGYGSTKQVSKAETWSEFKREHRHRLLSGKEEAIPLEEQHIPLVDDLQMSEGTLPALLSKLKLSKTTSLKDLKKESASRTGLMYDVYQPNLNFRKTDPPLPNHRLVVTKPDGSLPSLSDLVALEAESRGVPVYHAVSDNADISFYHYAQECVPPDLYQEARKPKKSRHRKYISSSTS